MICPIMSKNINNISEVTECVKTECSFYDKNNAWCAILTLAKNSESIKEVAEGQRVIFVRNY